MPPAHFSKPTFTFTSPPGEQGEVLFQHIESSKQCDEVRRDAAERAELLEARLATFFSRFDSLSPIPSAAAAGKREPHPTEAAEAAGQMVTEPKWWSGKQLIDPALYTIDCGGQAPELNDELRAKMQEIFDRVGVVYLSNTGMTDLDKMRPYMTETLMRETMEYSGGSNNRPELEAFFFEVGAPEQAWLHYHHEMAYVGKSTKMLGFACREALGGLRGSTFLSESVMATDMLLRTDLGRKLKEKGLCYVRNLNDAEAYKDCDSSTVYNHWQMSFGTDDPVEAERRARARGLQVTWGTDPLGNPRYMMTKYFVSAFEYFPQLDRNIIYSSVADDNQWFDTWPGVCKLKPEDRPLQLLFGDETPLTKEEWKLWIDIYDQCGIPIEWKVGDIAIVCNYRFAHGRPAYAAGEGEARTLGVVLGEVFDRVGDQEGKW